MSRKFLIPLLAAVTAAFVIAPGSTWAQFNMPGVGGGAATSSDRMGGGGGKGTAQARTVKSSKSNTSDRMGGGGGAKGAAGRARNLNTSRSN